MSPVFSGKIMTKITTLPTGASTRTASTNHIGNIMKWMASSKFGSLKKKKKGRIIWTDIEKSAVRSQRLTGALLNQSYKHMFLMTVIQSSCFVFFWLCLQVGPILSYVWTREKLDRGMAVLRLAWWNAIEFALTAVVTVTSAMFH